MNDIFVNNLQLNLNIMSFSDDDHNNIELAFDHKRALMSSMARKTFEEKRLKRKNCFES